MRTSTKYRVTTTSMGNFTVDADEYVISGPSENPQVPPAIEFRLDGKTVAHFFGVSALMKDDGGIS